MNASLSKEEILNLINSKTWFHRFEIVEGITTPGVITVDHERWANNEFPEDITGKRILEIGTWDGPYAFGLEKRGAKDRSRKTSMISFRIESQLKNKILDIALRENRSLSSLIVGLLESSLDSQGGNAKRRGIREEKRCQRRRQILLPARWRIRQEDAVLEYDVLLRNISVGGAYTEYMNGQNFQLLMSLQVSPLALAVRMPESEGPVVMDCEVSRIHITDTCIGVGLHFIADTKDLLIQP